MWYTVTYVSGNSTSTIRFLRDNIQLLTDYRASHTWREYLLRPSPREPQISLQSRQVLSESSTKIKPKWWYTQTYCNNARTLEINTMNSHQQRNRAMHFQFQIHANIHTRASASVRVCVCVCVYIYIYIHTHTHTRARARTSIGVVYAAVSC